MKRWFFLLLSIIGLAFLQLTWPVFLSFFNCKPDFLLILIVALVFYLDFKAVLVFAVLTGLTKDLFLTQPFAINTILFSIWSYLIYLLRRQISTENDYVQVAIVLIASLLNNIVSGLQIVGIGAVVPAGIFLRNLVIPSVYTALLSPLVFKLVKKIVA